MVTGPGAVYKNKPGGCQPDDDRDVPDRGLGKCNGKSVRELDRERGQAIRGSCPEDDVVVDVVVRGEKSGKGARDERPEMWDKSAAGRYNTVTCGSAGAKWVKEGKGRRQQ